MKLSRLFNPDTSSCSCHPTCVQYLATIFSCMLMFVPGVNYAWTSPYLPRLWSNTSRILITNDDALLCAVLPFVADVIGASTGGFFMNFSGRKWTIFGTMPIQVLGCLFLAFSTKMWEITTARCFLSFTDGILMTVLPSYVAEISEPERRGILTSSIMMFSFIGMLFINIIGTYASILFSSLIILFVPIFSSVFLCLMPESPYYLIKKRKYDEARKSLEILVDEIHLDYEFGNLIEAVRRQESYHKNSVLDLFVVARNRKACFIYLILCLISKFSGKTPIMLYTVDIFEETKSSLNPNLSTIIIGVVEILTIAFSIFWVDKFGKKTLVIISSIGCCVCLILFGLYLHFREQYFLNLDWLPLFFMIIYNILFNCGLSFGYVSISSELFPTSVKGAGLAAAEITTVILAGISTLIYIFLTNNFGEEVPFFVFGVCVAVLLVPVIKFVPETEGKSLERVQYELQEMTSR